MVVDKRPHPVVGRVPVFVVEVVAKGRVDHVVQPVADVVVRRPPERSRRRGRRIVRHRGDVPHVVVPKRQPRKPAPSDRGRAVHRVKIVRLRDPVPQRHAPSVGDVVVDEGVRKGRR